MLYVELNCFCIAILLIISLNMRHQTNQYLFDQKLYLGLLLTTALLLILDTFMWTIDGVSAPAARTANIVISALYYVLNPVVGALWYFYVDYYVNRSRTHIAKILIPILIPLFVNLILSVVSLFGGVLFYIDADNVYHRGPLFLVMAAISFFYILYALVFMVMNRKKMQVREYRTLLAFPVIPIVGGIVQVLFYGVSLLWACVTMSLLIIFIYFQNGELNTDHLTGLYNRRQLDRFLRTKNLSAEGVTIAGLMIDLNSFKSINDTYGHSSGDQALKYTAEILQKTFRKSDFVARYGGDEFVVIMEITERAALDKAVARLNENLAQFNAQKLIPFEIGLSIGYDYYSAGKSAAEFLRHIDNLMYSEKQKVKKAVN